MIGFYGCHHSHLDLNSNNLMDTFDFIPTGGNPDGIRTGYCVCKKCGVCVETGIINLSKHWSECSRDDFAAIMTWAAKATAKSPEELERNLKIVKEELEK